MDGTVNRRDVLRFGMALGLAGTVAPAAVGAQDKASPVWRLEVDIPGLPNASRNIREVAIDPLVVEPNAIPPGQDVDFRLYGPGHAHWGSASFTSAVSLGASKELQTWFNDAAKGKDVRKNITVTLFKSDRSAGRSYNLMDCFPTQWSAVNFDTSSTVQTETIRVKLGRVEFKV